MSCHGCDHHSRVAPNHTRVLSDSSGSRNSEMGLTGMKSKCLQGCVPSGIRKREAVSLPLPDCRGRLPALARGPSLHPQRASSQPLLLY